MNLWPPYRFAGVRVVEIAPDYSMFRMIVNFVGEKSRWVEGL